MNIILRNFPTDPKLREKDGQEFSLTTTKVVPAEPGRLVIKFTSDPVDDDRFRNDRYYVMRGIKPGKEYSGTLQWSKTPDGRGGYFMRALAFAAEDFQIIFRMQARGEEGIFFDKCPPDQERTGVISWNPKDETELVWTKKAGSRIRTDTGSEFDTDDGLDKEEGALAKLQAMDEADLEVEAAKRGVNYDKRKSKSTLVKEIAQATTPAK